LLLALLNKSLAAAAALLAALRFERISHWPTETFASLLANGERFL
jgi:hypothetical protein